MLIALDYDDTFTEDVDFWCQVVALGRLRGHNFVCVTARSSPPDVPREPHIPMPIVCAGNEYKKAAAERAGFRVDVWIDDLPQLITGEGRLNFDEEPTDAQLVEFMKILSGIGPDRTEDECLRAAWHYVKGIA